jgi:hypothetical protein
MFQAELGQKANLPGIFLGPFLVTMLLVVVAFIGVSFTGSYSYGASARPTESMFSLPVSYTAPDLICNGQGSCGSWEYFVPGEYCLSIYPSTNGNSACQWVTYTPQRSLSGAITACIVGIGAIFRSAQVGSEFTLGDAIFACGYGALGYLFT